MARFDADHDNLRAALRWAIATNRSEPALDLVSACAWYWFMAGHWRESWEWLSKALSAGADAAPEARARALYTAGALQVIRNNPAVVLDGIREALDVCRASGDRFGEAWCLHLLGHAGLMEQRLEALTDLEAARRIFSDLGATWEVAWSDRYLGDALAMKGEGRRGVELQLASISAFREMGDLWSTAYGLYNVGALMVQLPEYGPNRARPYLVRCLRIARQIGDRVWEAHALRTLGEAAYLTHSEEAPRLFADVIDRLRLLGDDTCLSTSLGLLGELEADAGDHTDAARCIGEALRIRSRLENRLGMTVNVMRVALLAAAAGHGEEAGRLAGFVDAEVAGWPASVPTVFLDLHRRLMQAVAGHDVPPTGDPIEMVVSYALEVAEMIGDEGADDADRPLGAASVPPR